MGFRIVTKGSFKHTKKYLIDSNKVLSLDTEKVRDIADETLIKLKEASPYESIANAWSYEIKTNQKGSELIFNNSNIENGVNVAIIVDSGHASSSGKWVSGKNYIKKPISDAYKKIFKEMEEALKRL